MGIVESLALIVVFAAFVVCFSFFVLGCNAKKYDRDDIAKSHFCISGISLVLMILALIGLCILNPQLLSNSSVDGQEHFDACQCSECLNEKENIHDADCQCIDCKPHDADCQCNDCVEKYCNSFNHGDTCQCEKCLYCKEYGK